MIKLRKNENISHLYVNFRLKDKRKKMSANLESNVVKELFELVSYRDVKIQK